MRSVPLGEIKTGINRLREKGGASSESLYDAVNCYVTASRSVEMRPASVHAHALPAGMTKGLMLYKGKFLVFASEPVEAEDPDYAVAVLRHPSDSSATLVDIHFAVAFLGYPYVTAEWSDGLIKDYWLQTAEAWQANTTYRLSAVVQPTVPNGYSYRAHRLGEPGQIWAPDVERAVGDVVEPTQQNGFEYVCIEAFGNPPRSADVEPDWPEEEGAIVVEEADLAPSSGSSSDDSPRVPPDVEDRYGSGLNRSGSGSLA